MVFIGNRRKITNQKVEKFRTSLEKSLKDIDRSKIGYVSLIGSVDSNASVHDIDIMMFPSKNAGMGESILEMNRFYDCLDERLQRDQGLYIATCPKKILQPETYHIIGQEKSNEKMIPLHTLFYPDYCSFNAINPVDFKEKINNSLIPLIGEFDNITERENIPQKVLEPYFFIIAHQIPLIADRYPEKLVEQKTLEVLDYLETHYDISDIDKPRNLSDCKKVIKEALNMLDKL